MRKVIFACSILFLASNIVACGDETPDDPQNVDDHHHDDDNNNDNHHHDDHTQHHDDATVIAFKAIAGNQDYAGMGMGEDPDCIAGMGTSSTAIMINDLRFFISEIQVHNATEGVWTSFALVDSTSGESGWQNDGIALIDLSDYAYNNGGEGTAGMNNYIEGTLEEGNYDRIRFTLGVPFETNHADHTTSAAPINATGMSWGWLSGLRFMRLDAQTCNAEESRGTVFHLGSTGCEGDPGQSPDVECKNPNRSVIELTWTPGDNIVFDVDALFHDSDMTNTGGPDLCMSGADDTDCAPLFQAIGIPFGDDAGGDQTVFFTTDETITTMRH